MLVPIKELLAITFTKYVKCGEVRRGVKCTKILYCTVIGSLIFIPTRGKAAKYDSYDIFHPKVST